MAPEVLRRLPLDQRTDLFALGAIGYWALTGTHAFPARAVQDLPTAWQRTPRALSQLVPGIPPALDELIMSLLSMDPLARPANAAAVIDQLTAIAELEPEEHEQAAESYLSSGRMVGRAEERTWLQQRMGRALDGKGAEVVIEGPSGIGKTRLLHEVSLEAQLKGAVALRADAQAQGGAFSVAATLAVQLLNALPDAARRAAAADAKLLAHLSPELASALETEAGESLSDDPSERRARFQTALHEWFLKVAAEQTLLVAVDNLQAADDNSAAFLAALGYTARHAHLMLLVTQTTGDEVVAEVPLRALRKRASRLKLAGLCPSACEELVCSLFGNVANTGRLAKLLYDRSTGNPQLCMDLAQLLVKRKIAKYVDGEWVLPLELAEDELPHRADELLRAKLAGLGPEAKKLCEALSIYGQRVSIERCLALYEGTDERKGYLALDELVAEQILLAEGGNYGFRQQALRESVLAQIDEARRSALHLRAADTLLAGAEQNVSAQMEAAWHLLHAGEEARGADLIAGATRVFLRHQGVESVEQVVRAIETALDLYEKQKRSKYEIASLLFPLMSLAFFVDWRVTLKHGERAIKLGLDITGLGLAQRLSRFLPGKLALVLGLGTAAVRFAYQQARGLKFNLIEAIESFCGLVPATVGTQNIVFDLPATKRFTEMLRPLQLFGKDHIASLMFDFANSQYLMSHGREREAAEVLEELRRVFPNPELRKVLGEGHWKAMYGGILFAVGIGYAYEFGNRALAIAREMEELGVRVWAMAAEEVRMLHHAMRGEAEAVQRCRERVELFAVQGSTTWQADIFWPILLLDSEIRAGDTIAVRTIREQLSRRAKDHPSLQAFADVAHCAYLAMRGDHKAAIEGFERLHEGLRAQDPELGWPAFRASFAFANALNAAGQHERAKCYATESLARAGADVAQVVGHYLEPQRQLALAEAGLGNHAQATAMLDDLLERSAREDQPMLIGLLHKARAEVALQMKDEAAFTKHAAEMEQRFRGAGHPALRAQSEQLTSRARTLRSRGPDDVSLALGGPSAVDSVGPITQRALSDLSSSTERAELALRLVLQRSRGKTGYLYLQKDERMELAAASTHTEPPEEVQARLLHEITQARQRACEDDSMTAAIETPDEKSVFISSVAAPASDTSAAIMERYRVLVLSTGLGASFVAVGGVIIEVDPEQRFAVDADLLGPIASALHECSLAMAN